MIPGWGHGLEVYSGDGQIEKQHLSPEYRQKRYAKCKSTDVQEVKQVAWVWRRKSLICWPSMLSCRCHWPVLLCRQSSSILRITHKYTSQLWLGFISIMRYRDIDRGIGDLVIIAVPRDQTISRMKASLMRALLNSSLRIHRVIIIARKVTGCHVKGFDRRPVGDSQSTEFDQRSTSQQ